LDSQIIVLTALSDSPARRIDRFLQGVTVMFPFWMNVELSQLHEFMTTSFVAVASAVSWLFLAGRP
jgi:hypothetical protein